MFLRLTCVCAFTLLFTLCLIYLRVEQNLDREVDGWGRNSIRNLSYYLKEELIDIIPEKFCKSQITLLIVVNSAPSNKLHRQAIRETWGKEKTVLKRDISVIFFIGISLNSSIQDEIALESQQYDDIIHAVFLESYYNLTLKSVLITKTVADRCIGKAKYLLKIDDDMFLQVPKLIELIIIKNQSENLLIGRMQCSPKRIKNPFDKWYCPSYLYEKQRFPNFVSGGSYLMSIDVTKKLFAAAVTTPLIHLEDVYLTGMCAEKAGIFPEFDARFTTALIQDGSCQMKDLITMHDFSPIRMKKTFNALNNSNFSETCNNLKIMFSVSYWLETRLFLPISRSKRKRICQ